MFLISTISKKQEIEGCIISSVVPQITNIVKLAAEKNSQEKCNCSWTWCKDRAEYYDG